MLCYNITLPFNIFGGFNMPKLNTVIQNLNRQYDNYTKERQKFSFLQSRRQRDDEFETLLNKLCEKKLSDENIEKILYEVCNFYEKNKTSGGFLSEPALIKYIRQALYSIFEVGHSPPKSRYGSFIIRYNDPTPETDYSVKILHKALEEFRRSMEPDLSEGISLE